LDQLVEEHDVGRFPSISPDYASIPLLIVVSVHFHTFLQADY